MSQHRTGVGRWRTKRQHVCLQQFNPDKQNKQQWLKSTSLIFQALLHYDPLRRFAVNSGREMLTFQEDLIACIFSRVLWKDYTHLPNYKASYFERSHTDYHFKILGIRDYYKTHSETYVPKFLISAKNDTEKLKICCRKRQTRFTFVGPCIANVFSSITNKMQRYTIYLFLWNALYVSGGSSAHHQEIKTVYSASCILSNLYCYLPLSWQAAVKVWQNTRCWIYSFDLLMMGGGTAWNM